MITIIAKVLVTDYTKSMRNLILKIIIPFFIVFISKKFGFAEVSLIMLIMFATLTGSGINVVKLKISGIYNRIIVSPISKPIFFLKFVAVYTLLYFMQFLPATMLVAAEKPILIVFIFLSVAMLTALGTLLGIYSRSLGSMHFNATLLILPLIALSMAKTKLSYILPLTYIRYSCFAVENLILTFSSMLFLYIFLIVKAGNI